MSDARSQVPESGLAAMHERDTRLSLELQSILAAADAAHTARLVDGAAELGRAAAATLIGRSIGSYRIEALIGEGSSASVWRARHSDSHNGEAVALKLLHLSRMSPVTTQRFAREGAILARLAHANIARLLDLGASAEGQPFLALELVEGRRLDAHCQAAGLSVAQRLTLFGQVLLAVSHAHARGVIHRDIKPGNILVSAGGWIKLIDFGVAKCTDRDMLPLTAGGHRLMTTEYAAPEQLRGGPVTPATDVHALGVVLAQLLTGFTSSATRPADDRRSSLIGLRRRLRGPLRRVVTRCLLENPSERYADAATLAEALAAEVDP
jgi:eukaryotic-like serine/threonine-protein kinase